MLYIAILYWTFGPFFGIIVILKLRERHMAKNSTYTPVTTNTNNALNLIKDSLNESNNAIVADPVTRRTDLDKTGGETLAAYNQRVTPGVQPVQPAPTKSYLGNNL